MLHTLKKLVPLSMLRPYHHLLARTAEIVYGHPSDKMIVIGVTGTNGKSSTINFIAQLLTELGETVGYTSTAGFSIAGKTIENKMKMTMPGRFYLQKILRQMLDAGCDYAIIETSSQGLDQYRHLGINYDVAVFTNLTPEHIEAHGGFENYKKAKGKLFAHLSSRSKKTLGGKIIEKTSIVNGDDEHAAYFVSFAADRHLQFHEADYENVPLPLSARFERLNATAAMATVMVLGFPRERVLEAAQKLRPVAGRFEKIEEGQPFGVIVDYAYEPYALKALYEAIRKIGYNQIIGVHGSAGGGRDIARRPIIGKLAGEEESIVIVTNEDPYDEDPRTIIEAVAAGAKLAGKIVNKDLFLINDRQEAIDRAIAFAKPGDAVIITGKGSEPVMAVKGGKKVPWDDRKAARLALNKLGYKT